MHRIIILIRPLIYEFTTGKDFDMFSDKRSLQRIICNNNTVEEEGQEVQGHLV